MCLSQVFVVEDEKRTLFCKDIQTVHQTADDNYVFTDLFGAQFQKKGKILRVDMIHNEIHLEESK
ncbi:CooT family nickel-binding protein [Guggenheimella bovis]